jgi:hypothetical protein
MFEDHHVRFSGAWLDGEVHVKGIVFCPDLTC